MDKLFSLLEKRKGHGEPFSRKELKKLLQRKEAGIVYSDMLLKYAVPNSKVLQEKEAEDYTKIFLAPKRINKGVDFIKKHFSYLDEAEKQYGVAKKDIVSIMMWESGLGEFTGNYQIFNIFMGQILFIEKAEEYAIESLKKDGKKNPYDDKAFKQKAKKRIQKIKNNAIQSLVSLLRESKHYGIDPLKQLGSWGGAIGYIQFMPYNLRYIVDGDNDGKKDLFTFPDAIFSCANFLKKVGKYKQNETARSKAIYRYNPSTNYVKGVIMYADTVWAEYNKGK